MLLKDRIQVGHHILHNRMVKAPIFSNSCKNGHITQETEKHYADRTRGGRFGLVVVEHTYVRDDGMAAATQLSSSADSDIEGLKRLCDIIHGNGSKAILQINHAGCGAERAWTGQQPVSASDVSISCGLPGSAPNPEKPHPLTLNEIDALKECYVKAAVRAMKAGYDGINLHSAHGYFLNQFYSPIANKRTDAYNGYTLDGRIRLHLELIRMIREAIGDEALFALRLGACDYTTGGSTIDDAVRACQAFEAEGVDLIDISGGTCSFIRKGHPEPGYFGDVSVAVKKAVKIPVLLTGGVKSPADAETLLQEGKADLVGTGRAITKNPDWGMELAK